MMGMFDHRVCACTYTCEYNGHVIGSGRSMSSERLFFAHLAKTLAFEGYELRAFSKQLVFYTLYHLASLFGFYSLGSLDRWQQYDRICKECSTYKECRTAYVWNAVPTVLSGE